MYLFNRREKYGVFVYIIVFLLIPVARIYAQQASFTIAKGAKLGDQEITSALMGEPFYYSIEFEASATNSPAINATVTDTLPANIIFLGTGGDDGGYTQSVNYDAGSHSVTWTLVNPFPTGTKVEVYLDVKFKHGNLCPGDSAVNRAWVHADNAESRVTNDVVVTADVLEPGLSLNKTRVVDCPVVETGRERYNISILLNNGVPSTSRADRYVHVGSQSLTRLIVRDILPPNTVVVDAPGATVNGDTVTWDLGRYIIDEETGRMTEWPAGWDTQQYPFCCFGNYTRGYTLVVSYPDAYFDPGDEVINRAEFIVTRACKGDTVLVQEHSHELCPPGDEGMCSKSFLLRWPKEAVIGQSVTFRTTFSNSGNVPLDTLFWVDAIPGELDLNYISGITIGNGGFPAPPIYGRYKTTENGAVWQDMDGSPYSSNPGRIDFLPPNGEYVDSLRFFLTQPMPAGCSYRIDYSTTLLDTTHDDSAVEIGDIVRNCMVGTWIYEGVQHPFSCCDQFTVIPLKPPEVDMSKQLADPLPPLQPSQGDTISFTIALTHYDPTNADEPLINPVAADFLPLGWELVDWSGSSSTVPHPRLEVLEDFDATGRTLLRWHWDGPQSYTFANSGERYRFLLRVKPGPLAINGNTENRFYLVKSDNSGGFRVHIDYPFPERGFYTQDSYDFDEDGIRDERIIYEPASVITRGTLEYSGSKQTRSLYTAEWTMVPDTCRIPAGDVFECRLKVINTGQAPLDSLEIIDIFPFNGDTDVTGGPPQARESQWAPVLEQPVVVSGARVYYSTSGNPCRPEFASGSCETPNWNMTPPSNLNEIKSIRLLCDVLIPVDSSFSVAYRMRAPASVPQDDVAWNSFAVRGNGGESWSLVTEPQKAGASVFPRVTTKENGRDVMVQDSVYTSTLSFIAPSDIDSACVIDTLPACLSYISSTGGLEGGYEITPGVVYWGFRDLAAGDEKILTVSYRVSDVCDTNRVDNCGGLYAYDLQGRRVLLSWGCDLDEIILWGEIGDYVWEDTDGDNVQDNDETGIPDVVLYLVDAAGDTVGRDTTSADGLYLFDRIFSGEYTIYIDETTLPSGYFTTGAGTSRPVILADGETFMLGDFGFNTRQPIAVRLAEYSIEAQDNGIMMRWKTSSEINNAGFNIYKSTAKDKDYVKVNEKLVPGQGNSLEGAAYEFSDRIFENGTFYYRLEDVAMDGRRRLHKPLEIEYTNIPKEYYLYQNFPNPFNPFTTVRYDIPRNGRVFIAVYDTRGRLVRRLVDATVMPGVYNAVWDARSDDGIPVPSGLYFCRFLAPDYSAIRKLILIK